MRLPSLVLAGALSALALPAAASEDDSALSISLGYGTVSVPDHQLHGGVLGLEYERGISDVLAWRIAAGGGFYYEDAAAWSSQGTLGLTYVLDVLKYVPYAMVGVGGIVVGGGELETDASALIELGGGLDILHSRELSYGLQVKFETLLQETSFFTAGARITWRWGFF